MDSDDSCSYVGHMIIHEDPDSPDNGQDSPHEGQESPHDVDDSSDKRLILGILIPYEVKDAADQAQDSAHEGQESPGEPKDAPNQAQDSAHEGQESPHESSDSAYEAETSIDETGSQDCPMHSFKHLTSSCSGCACRCKPTNIDGIVVASEREEDEDPGFDALLGDLHERNEEDGESEDED